MAAVGILLTRFGIVVTATVLAAHLFGIALTTLGAIGVHDAALTLSLVSLAVSPADQWTVDHKFFTRICPATQ